MSTNRNYSASGSCHIIHVHIYVQKFPGWHVTFWIHLFFGSAHPRRWDLKQKHFLLIFIEPICSQKCILDSPLHIYKDIPEGRAMSDSFWSITSNIPHMRFLPLEGEKKKKNNFWEMVYCNLETELCKHWVKSSLFPVTLSLMKVAKSPGGLRSTVCLCLGERSRGTRGEARW